MPSHAQDERHALADLFDRIGPSARTLCEGWTTADLAAHLVLRERRPDAAGGILVPPLAGYADRVQRNIKDGRSWPALVDQVRNGPPALLAPIDELVNTVEYFVHHEDVRRAEDGWEPRILDPGLERALWRRLKIMAPLLFRRVGQRLHLTAPGYGTITRGSSTNGEVTATGAPGELVIAGFGRLAHARIDLAGQAADVHDLRETRLGL